MILEYGNNRVSIFDTNGCFIHCFGEKLKAVEIASL